ncbi:MAG: YggS family pyridoxal phosphate-dependent enzyme [Clostridium argentinense]|uniref:Pyridoxal phosphate homeostasis protein n=1 Tax=Clostridium faecium TaxID=2762223 RepID=A0ABR8YQG5_9CLOT|nr:MULTISPECIES: YggS family pyridoxal phosphate-dependent enzyme [Clostridium]MBD8046473.1 YggS family pyridoxal phosphate-dependent enzyme [Clostridium faecium]MBS5823193.1 YggS family pyridoxal phosphate-dependent enzyme [Clostridium argentinense]MDU1348987.1 YggS family pyridoxal phosphate-dependent enzyme [Clostridium argentinense]
MSIRHNYEAIMNKISNEVTLISVSKTKPIEDLVEAYEAGARDFGENKVQELNKKYDQLPKDIRWHLIGHLQRNKVKYLVGKVHLIHSLDSVRLAEEIEKQFSSKDEIANVLIQINIGREASKTGVKIEELEELLNACERCNSIKVKGLMATIPIGNEESCRYYFSEMKKIFDNLSKRSFKNISMEILSMGMTHDYEIAIEEGSNMIRVGEGVFGKRQYN